MNERELRSYLQRRKNDIVVNAVTRGSITDKGIPEAIAWVGFKGKGTISKILPILIHSSVDGEINHMLEISKQFASNPSSNKGNRIVTPIYIEDPARPLKSDYSDPTYQIQMISTRRPEIDSVSWNQVQDYAQKFEQKSKESYTIRPQVGTPADGYVPLNLKISAPGALFKTKIPFFLGDPDDHVFENAVGSMVVPCISVAESNECHDSDSFTTMIKKPYVGD